MVSSQMPFNENISPSTSRLRKLRIISSICSINWFSALRHKTSLILSHLFALPFALLNFTLFSFFQRLVTHYFQLTSFMRIQTFRFLLFSVTLFSKRKLQKRINIFLLTRMLLNQILHHILIPLKQPLRVLLPMLQLLISISLYSFQQCFHLLHLRCLQLHLIFLNQLFQLTVRILQLKLLLHSQQILHFFSLLKLIHTNKRVKLFLQINTLLRPFLKLILKRLLYMATQIFKIL